MSALTSIPEDRIETGPMDVREFIKAFIAGLVTKGFLELHPHEPATRRGFRAVVEDLDRAAKNAYSTGGATAIARQLTQLSNALRASSSGAYDGFESAMRQVQLTFTSSPNPDYDEIAFSVPKTYAVALINNLNTTDRKIVENAVEMFVGAIEERGDEHRHAEETA